MGYGVRGLASPHPSWVPQVRFPFLDRVLQLPIVLQRRVRAVQTVQKLELPPCSSSTLFTCPLLCVDSAGDGPDSAENREDSARVLGHGSCPSLCKKGAGWSRQCRKLWSRETRYNLLELLPPTALPPRRLLRIRKKPLPRKAELPAAIGPPARV